MSVMGFSEAVDIAEMQREGVRQSSNGMIATFYRRPVQNQKRSETEGRPCFDSLEYIEILIAGDNKTKVNRRVKEEDQQRWPQAWEKFKNNEKGVVVGTPLEEWSFLTATRVAELKALGMTTVEEVAGMADAYLGKLGPDGRKLQGRAKQFLEASSDLEQELRTAIQTKDTEIDNLKADMAALQRQFTEMREGKVDRRTKAFKESQKEE